MRIWTGQPFVAVADVNKHGRGYQTAIEAVLKGNALAASVDAPFNLTAEETGHAHHGHIECVGDPYRQHVRQRRVGPRERGHPYRLASVNDSRHPLFKKEKDKSCEVIEEPRAPIVWLGNIPRRKRMRVGLD